MVRSVLPLSAALLGATRVLAQTDPSIPTCSMDQKCPQEVPCCSQYGQCGVGAFCLGGCDPRMSFSLDSCVPAPVCESKVYPMTSTDGIVDVSEYLGDPSKADWVTQGKVLPYNGNVLLTMPANSVGTVMASTTYLWYGNVKARMKTSRGPGVVTAFICFSDVKDEIDYEWVGADLTVAQTNYYFQGIPDYQNSGNITGLSDTYNNWHDYEIRWTPDDITWLVDGKVGRVKKRSETFNATSNQWGFPQTPCRVQFSIWPGGSDKNAQGTVDWAGGPIDWNSPDIQSYGYDFAQVGQVEIECYNATSPPGTNLHTSYTYSSIIATNDTVIDGDKPTVLKSFLGTGLDMDAAEPSGSATNSAKAPVATVPGGSVQGPGQAPQNAGSSSSDDGGSGSSGSSSGGGSGNSGTNSAPGCATTGFSQDCGGGSSSKNGGSGKSAGARVEGKSAFAVVVFGAVAVAGLAAWL